MTKNMTIDILSCELHTHSQSWIALCNINFKYLFYIEWNYRREIENIQILYFFDWYKRV